MKISSRAFFLFVTFLGVACLPFILTGCGSSKPAEQPKAPEKYELTGRVVSVDLAKQEVDVDGADIPGFMGAMTMPYSVKNPDALKQLAPEDQIKADIMVGDRDMWLENIVVVKKPDQAKTPAPEQSAPTTPDKQE